MHGTFQWQIDLLRLSGLVPSMQSQSRATRAPLFCSSRHSRLPLHLTCPGPGLSFRMTTNVDDVDDDDDQFSITMSSQSLDVIGN